MYPILVSIGTFDIRAWGVMVALGILLGLMLTVRLARGTEYSEEIWLDFILYATIIGLLGARLWEVIFSWQNYAGNPLHAVMFWDGGLSIQGAIVSTTIFAWWYVKKKGLSFWRFADYAAPGLILGQALGRIGCLLNGDAFGKPTTAWYGVVYQPGTPAYNAWGAIPLVPAELFEAIGDFGIVAVLLWLFNKRKFDGQIALTYFIMYSLLRFGLEFFRTDSLMLGGLKVAQISALLIAAIALSILIKRFGNKAFYNKA